MLGSTPNILQQDVKEVKKVANGDHLPFHLQRAHTFSSSLRTSYDKFSKISKGIKTRIYHSEEAILDCPDFDTEDSYGTESNGLCSNGTVTDRSNSDQASSDRRNSDEQEEFIPGRRIRSISDTSTYSHACIDEIIDSNAALERDYEEFMRRQNTDTYVHEYKPNNPNALSLSISLRILSTLEEEKPVPQKHISMSITSLADSVKELNLIKRFKSEPDIGPTMEESFCEGTSRIRLDPAGTGVFLSDKREMLIMDPGENFDCIVRDNDNEVRFQCVVSHEGIMCRNKTCDLVSIASSPLGVYVSIEGSDGCQIAKIKRGKALSRIKTQVNLLTSEDRHALCISTRTLTTDVPVLKQSLYVINDKKNIQKIVTKTNRTTVATIQKQQSRYYLYIEPNIDACFISALASYVLRRKIFGNNMPQVLEMERKGNFITRRTRRLSMSFKKIRKSNTDERRPRLATVLSGEGSSASGEKSRSTGYTSGTLGRERHMTYG